MEIPDHLKTGEVKGTYLPWARYNCTRFLKSGKAIDASSVGAGSSRREQSLTASLNSFRRVAREHRVPAPDFHGNTHGPYTPTNVTMSYQMSVKLLA